MAPKLSGLYPAILAPVSRRPDATIAELRAWLLVTHKISARPGLMHKALGDLCDSFSPGECANDFRHDGYFPST